MAFLVIQNQPMTLVLILVVWAIAIPLMIWNARVMTRFEKVYRFDGEFPGNRHECILQFANTEFHYLCAAGANQSALYLLPPAEHEISRWKSSKEKIYKKSLQIPWSDLQYRTKKILFQDYLWLEIPERKVYFYIPKDVGDRLLIDAGRAVPIEA